ncbi:GlxA family transcriptional regulator [Bradyrhizobium sp. CCGE-LA001]|uniref:GlxA family transcriptional regulator n=3 Tax=unclassified Bradyrhizobium TaxID=2631580 RepID=UPI000745D09E|nr:GlxA family transcriptional regulator [Bradyrhizobium sp. CCGE-LA001]AMA61100.1 transcriptional regulator [Bradyrhizobium sp. CCGE-LA001]
MARSAARRVVFVLFDQCLLLDFAGPLQAFELACETSQTGRAPYVWQTCSLKGGPVKTSSGLEVMTSALADCDLRNIDTLIVGGGPGVHRAAAEAALIDWFRLAAPKARRVCSVCTGTFVLAAAGLLRGRRAVTHWGSCDLLREKYPDVSVQVDPVFVHDRGIWTSAGVTAGIDLALTLLEDDLGHREAMRIARRLVVFLKRPGGQAQFSVPLSLQASDDRAFEKISNWMQDNLGGDLRVEKLAERAGMSPRTFARVFRQKTGRTPGKAVEELRVEAARRALEESASPIKEIAARSGFQSEEHLRRAFRRRLNVLPHDYRVRFYQGQRQ